MITGVSPNSGPIAGGTQVTISGRDLADAIEVDFNVPNYGIVPAYPIISNSDSQIVVTSPDLGFAATADITVYTAGGTVDRFPDRSVHVRNHADLDARRSGQLDQCPMDRNGSVRPRQRRRRQRRRQRQRCQ